MTGSEVTLPGDVAQLHRRMDAGFLEQQRELRAFHRQMIYIGAVVAQV